MKFRNEASRTLAIGCCIAVTAGCGGNASAPVVPLYDSAANAVRATLAPPGNVPVPPKAIYFGAWVNPNPEIAVEQQTQQLEKTLGRTLATHMHYYGWNDITTVALANDETIKGDQEQKRIPVISWGCGDNLTTIANGNAADDDTIKAAAVAIKDLKVPVFVRFFWEFNLDVDGKTINNDAKKCFTQTDEKTGTAKTLAQKGAEFVKAWTHIHKVFVGAGATNVSFLWNPTGGLTDVQNFPYVSFYPTGYVDWIGVDVYDKTNSGFEHTISPFYNYVRKEIKSPPPMLVGETAEQADNGQGVSQATYIGEATASLQAEFPAIRGFMWFDADPKSGYRWSLDTGGLPAFKTMGETDYFRAPTY